MPSYFHKDPDAKKDYRIDWSDWLDTDTIASSTWDVPTGLTEHSDSNDDTTTTIWLSGGTAGTEYEVRNRITTTGGRIEDRTITIGIREQ